MKHHSTQDLCFIGKNRYGNLNFVFWKVLEKLWKFFQPKLYEPCQPSDTGTRKRSPTEQGFSLIVLGE